MRVLIVAAIRLFVVAAIALPGLAADKPRVTLLVKSLANEFFVTMVEGAKAHAAANRDKYSLNVRGVPWEKDLALQARQLDEAIAERPAAIVIAPISSTELNPQLKKAVQAGIIVINIDNKLDDRSLAGLELNIPFVGPSNRAGARMAGDYVGSKLRSGDEVAIIEGASNAVNGQARTAGFREAMDAVGAKVVQVRSGEWEIARGEIVASDMLKAYPKLRALLCDNDNMAIGAIEALRKAGKTGQVLVAGYDNIPAVKPLIKSGALTATIDQFASKQAEFGIELALKAIQEKTGQAALPAIVQTQVQLVTQ
ncbi:substrate-binding domain-containing protein [Chitinimonas sp.]|uniref:substrate-binding domain-containing protein n=1 Tax=Chitinimonas sp. TaxID=1934313 RepID=UPI0035B1E23A